MYIYVHVAASTVPDTLTHELTTVTIMHAPRLKKLQV